MAATPIRGHDAAMTLQIGMLLYPGLTQLDLTNITPVTVFPQEEAADGL